MTTVKDAIMNRCSTRAYKPDELPEDVVKELIIAGLQAPTATNRQEVHISVVKTAGNATLQEIDDDIASAMKMTNRAHNFWYNAPLLFVLSAEDAFAKWGDVDSGIAVQNMALMAEELGLGNVIIGMMKGAMSGEKKAKYDKALGIPEGYSYTIAIAVGYPVQGKVPHTYDWDKNVTFIG